MCVVQCFCLLLQVTGFVFLYHSNCSHVFVMSGIVIIYFGMICNETCSFSFILYVINIVIY